MRPNIDFVECLKDSPTFRASLELAEDDIDTLETKLDKLVKLCNTMIDDGKRFKNSNSAFINGVKDLGYYFREDNLVSETLERFANGMQEINQFQSILLDQAHRSVCKNLKSFITNDIKKVKETRKHFEKISDDTDSAMIKNAQALKSRPIECEEGNNVLTAMKSCFQHTSLDYVFQINLLHSKKRCDVLHTLLSYMHAQNAYFHQGYDLFVDMEPYMKKLATQLEDLNKKTGAEKREMEERHTLVQQQKESLQNESPKDKTITMDGYLFKRTSKGFKSWVRRWFMIHKNQLVYRKRTKDSITIMEEDLRLCTVKPVHEIERRFCFEVVSPARSHILQADSEQECQTWISAIQTGVTEAYRDRSHTLPQEASSDLSDAVSNGKSSSPASSDNNLVTMETKIPQASKAASRLTLFMSIPGNDHCCDCGSQEPRWASINLGTTLCIECSGIHRSLGVHLSKVRSVTLDSWEPELLKVMGELGNNVVNSIYEGSVDETIATRATPQCNRNIREAWIKAKYVKKDFVKQLPTNTSFNHEGSYVKARKWSVYKRSRKSPARSSKSPEKEAENVDECTSKDSGLGNSSPDVLVFGSAATENEILNKSLDVDNSSESETDSLHDSDENKSTTSLEEVTRLDPNHLLFKAAEARNLPVMLEALALKADINWESDSEDGKTVLMKAVESGSLQSCEFLMLNGAKVDKKDSRGRTALHHAAIHGQTAQVCQLLKRGTNQHAVDEEGLDALTIAVNAANADIVTLLRLAKLNEEMKETDGFYGLGDETFSEVFRDFTNIASNDPEKLKRNASAVDDLESST